MYPVSKKNSTINPTNPHTNNPTLPFSQSLSLAIIAFLHIAELV